MRWETTIHNCIELICQEEPRSRRQFSAQYALDQLARRLDDLEAAGWHGLDSLAEELLPDDNLAAVKAVSDRDHAILDKLAPYWADGVTMEEARDAYLADHPDEVN